MIYRTEIALLAFANICRFAIAEPSQLPFYSEATLTPHWPGEEPPEHRIAAFELVDQNNSPFSHSDLQDQIWVANFFFTSCPGICARMTENVKAAQDLLSPDLPARFLSFSVTPEYDTPEILKQYETQHAIDGDRWSLLTGSKQTIYNLARTSFFADASTRPIDDSFIHTEKLFLIDKTGRIRGVYNGILNTDRLRLVEDIETLLAK